MSSSMTSTRVVEQAILTTQEDLKTFLDSAESLFYLLCNWAESHMNTDAPDLLLSEAVKASSKRVLTAREAVLAQAGIRTPWFMQGGGEKKLTDDEAAQALNLSTRVFRERIKPDLEAYPEGIPITEIARLRAELALRRQTITRERMVEQGSVAQ